MDVDGEDDPYVWPTSDDHPWKASGLVERGPEAFSSRAARTSTAVIPEWVWSAVFARRWWLNAA
jgi:hypothetical protein